MIFDGIPPDNGERTIASALDRIRERKKDYKLAEPWSLVELRPTEADYQWLMAWSIHLPIKTVRICLSGHAVPGQMALLHKIRTGVGVLILFLFSEIARREATEGSVWPVIWKQLSASGQGARALFANRIASHDCRELLRDTARFLQLRHLFDETGVQAWLGTIYLQFGFTHRGFRAMLPDWLLAEQQTVAIRSLRAGRLRSRSFDAMWGALWQLRRGRISPSRAREIIIGSEWIIDGWIQDLLNKATDRRRSNEPTTDQAPNIEIAPDQDFLSAPRLIIVNDGTPSFSCYVEQNYLFDPTSSQYEIVLGEDTIGLLLRQEDDAFVLYDSEVVTLNARQSRVTISLRDESGETVATQEMSLWTPDVAVFTASGYSISPDSILQSTGTYYLLCSPDLSARPEEILPLYASSTLSLYRLASGWSENTRITANGQPIWGPRTSQRTAQLVPEWAQNIKVTVLTEERWGAALRIRIRHSLGVAIDFVRSAGILGVHEADGPGKTRVSGLRLEPSMHRPQLTLLIGLRHGDEFHTLRHQIDTSEYVGCAIYADGEIRSLRPQDTLSLPVVNSAFRFFPPHAHGINGDGALWTVLEGDFCIISPPERACRLSDLAGYGAPVTLRFGPYNAHAEQHLYIARSVEDHGVLRDVQIEETEIGRVLRVTLDRHIAAASEHCIRTWSNSNGNECAFRAEEIHSEGCVWSVPWTEEQTPSITALFFDETRLGACWTTSWLKPVEAILAEDVGRAARLLRDLKLPVLDEICLKSTRSMALNHDPAAFLSAWMVDQDPAKDTSTSDRWGEVIRRVFAGCKPSPDVALQILNTLGAESQPGLHSAWISGAHILAPVDPVFMIRLIREAGIQTNGQLKTGLKRLILLLADCTDLDSVKVRFNELLEDVQRRIVDKGAMDANFIERGLLRPAKAVSEDAPVSQTENENVQLAMQVPAFRRLLALYLTLKTL